MPGKSSCRSRRRAFDPGIGRDGEAEREREIDKLHAKIGQLTVERDLAKRSGRMSASDHQALIDRGEGLSIDPSAIPAARSGALQHVYRRPRPANDNDLLLMRRIDELYTAWPFFGSRRMTARLRTEGLRSTASGCSG